MRTLPNVFFAASLWLFGLYVVLDYAVARQEAAAIRKLQDNTWAQYCTELLVQRRYAALWSNEACHNTPIEVGGQYLFMGGE